MSAPSEIDRTPVNLWSVGPCKHERTALHHEIDNQWRCSNCHEVVILEGLFDGVLP